MGRYHRLSNRELLCARTSIDSTSVATFRLSPQSCCPSASSILERSSEMTLPFKRRIIIIIIIIIRVHTVLYTIVTVLHIGTLRARSVFAIEYNNILFKIWFDSYRPRERVWSWNSRICIDTYVGNIICIISVQLLDTRVIEWKIWGFMYKYVCKILLLNSYVSNEYHELRCTGAYLAI